MNEPKRVMSSGSSTSHSSDYNIHNLIKEILRKRIKKIVIMTGAGISTASGIRDFRSNQTGLYHNLSQFNIPYPEAIFERDFFRSNPTPFFKLAKDLIPNVEKYKPNKVHYFIRLLQDKNMLHRLYTQNIDGLESLAGIRSDKLIESHGSFRSATCTYCNTRYSGSFVKISILGDKIPKCTNEKCQGIVKPDIVFFGDDLPESFYKMHKIDFPEADLVIVMGTSLEVEPFASILNKSRANTPRLLLNKKSVGPFKRIKGTSLSKDMQILGDLVGCIEQLVDKLGWTEELNQLIERELAILERDKAFILDRIYFACAPRIDDRLRTLSTLSKHSSSTTKSNSSDDSNKQKILFLRKFSNSNLSNSSKTKIKTKTGSIKKSTLYKQVDLRKPPLPTTKTTQEKKVLSKEESSDDDENSDISSTNGYDSDPSEDEGFFTSNGSKFHFSYFSNLSLNSSSNRTNSNGNNNKLITLNLTRNGSKALVSSNHFNRFQSVYNLNDHSTHVVKPIKAISGTQRAIDPILFTANSKPLVNKTTAL